MKTSNISVPEGTPIPGAAIGTPQIIGDEITGDLSSSETQTVRLSRFTINPQGVTCADEENQPLWICSPLYIDAVTHDEQDRNHGRKLRWIGSEGKSHDWIMPVDLLAGDVSAVIARFLNEGMQISTNRKARDGLCEYLQQRVDKRLLCMPRTGWHRDSFVLPDRTISPPGQEEIVFQTNEPHRYADITVKGSLEGWQMTIGKWSIGNSRLMFGVSAAFAGPLLEFSGEQGGGFHYLGLSSGGKTTILRASASVIGSPAVVRTWRATTNALEGIAAAHNQLTLLLDEIGQLSPKEASEVAYMLGNGQGKSRATKTGAARDCSTWSLLYLSTGETTLTDHAAEAGKIVKAGVEVRCLNIEADAGAGYKVFETLHDAPDGGTLSDWIKEAAADNYGHPLREFLRWLVDNLDEVRPRIRESIEDFRQRNAAESSGEVQRAAKRFGLVAIAGELATEAGVTGWEPGDATAAAESCFRSYLTLRGTTGESDVEAAVRNVLAFIESHGSSRFQSLRKQNGSDQKIMNRAGFWEVTNDGVVYYFLPAAFKEACRGTSVRQVAEQLDRQGVLIHNPGRWTKKLRLPDLGPKDVYAVLLKDDAEADDD